MKRLRPLRASSVVGLVAKYGVLLFFAAVALYPVLLVVSTAVKDPRDATVDPFTLFTSVRLANLADAWTLGSFGDYTLNTVIVTVPSVVGVVVLSVVAGYALARMQFPGRDLVFYVFMLGLMVPFFSYGFSLFFQLEDMKLLNTLWAVILPMIAGAGGLGVPLGVFLMRAFFLDLPRELSDAARVDGCGEWGVFRHVMLPLALPGAAVLAVLAFMAAWNTFLLPLLYLSDQEQLTLAVGLYRFAAGRSIERELLGAGTLIMMLPIIIAFLLFQRQFIRGLTAGAVKG